MPQSKHSRLRELFRRLMSWLPRRARKEPEPPVDPYAYVTAPRNPGHPIAAGQPWLSYRKTDMVRPMIARQAGASFSIH
jgi:hypothetical protein